MSPPPPPLPPTGIYVPINLFFDDHEDLDVPAIRQHILRLVKGGIHGFVVQGSTGEAQHLSHDERKQTISLVRQTLDENGFQDVPIIAGCGAPSARESKKLCADAKEAGAGYVLVLTPSVWPDKMTRDAILAFHRDVATHSPLPYLVYNYPTVTAGLDLNSDIILELSDHPNIVGTKLSCGKIGKLHRLTTAKPSSEFATFSGVSDVLLQGLLSGSAGAITALPNIIPKLHTKLYQLYQDGNMEEAMKLQGLLGQGEFALSKLGGIGAIKALVVKHWGYGTPIVRTPLQALTAQQLSGPYFEKLEGLITMEKELQG